jgi:hypothetical protein
MLGHGVSQSISSARTGRRCGQGCKKAGKQGNTDHESSFCRAILVPSGPAMPLETGSGLRYLRPMQTITLPRPDDWHLHLRDGAMLQAVLPETARHFARAIIMPNLVPPVVTLADAQAYHGRIMAALPDGMAFDPLMTLYLTEGPILRTWLPRGLGAGQGGQALSRRGDDQFAFRRARSDQGHAGAGENGRIGLPLCTHGEVTDPAVDIFDREAVFIDTVLDPLRRRLPELRCGDGAYHDRGRRRLCRRRGATIWPRRSRRIT